MGDIMKYPSWDDVGIPAFVVNCIKDMPASGTLDVLIHQMVFRHRRKPQFTYWCDGCTFRYIPQRQHEEYAACGNCGGQKLRCEATMRFPPDTVPGYSRSYTRFNSLLRQMSDNHIITFGDPAERVIDCGWRDEMLYSRFEGGIEVEGDKPRLCLMKSALLVPYLWDIAKADEPTGGDHFSQVFAQLSSGGWRDQ